MSTMFMYGFLAVVLISVIALGVFILVNRNLQNKRESRRERMHERREEMMQQLLNIGKDEN